MTNEDIKNMLLVMHDMTKLACDNCIFMDVSTYVKNHCPNIEPEYVELFRDIFIPISNKNAKLNKSMPKYLMLGGDLFQHIVTSNLSDNPKNLYIYRSSATGGIDLERDLFTYEYLISKGAKIPTSEELLKVIY